MSKTLEELQRAALQQEALKLIGTTGLLGAGVGAGWRGLRGLLNLGHRNLQPRPQPMQLYQRIELPLPGEEKEKYAESGGMSWVPGWDALADPWRGNVDSPLALPLTIPGMFAGGGLGLYGGWKLADKLMDARRTNELDTELEQARKEYESALRGGSKLAAELDRLCDQLEKRADPISDFSGKTQGLGIAGLGLTGLLTGLVGYNLSKKQTPSAVLREAKMRRARARMRNTPLPIYAEIPQGARAPNEDELEGEPLDKAAYDNPNGVPPVPVKTSKPITTPDVRADGTPAPLPPGSESNHPTGPR